MLIGEMLLKEGMITQEQLDKALEVQGKQGGKLGSIIISEKMVDEEKVLNFLQQQLGIIAVNLDNWEIEKEVLALIPPDVAKKHQVVPIEKLGDTLTVVMQDPEDRKLIEDLTFITNCTIEPAISTERSILDAIDRYYKSAKETIEDKTKDFQDTVMEVMSLDGEEMDEETEEVIGGEEKPMVKLVNQIIFNGIRKGASDIHIEPYDTYVRLRYRNDGVLKTADQLPKNFIMGIVSRIKIISHLKISERRIPQDGKAQVKYEGRKIDLRVATVPCVHGEKVVIRILDKGEGEVTLDMLGFEQDQMEIFKKSIESPWGMILITGPTGSGKTWTLSTSLKLLNSEEVNIMTVEDPVEFDIEGLNQVQAKPEIGLTFASALKSFLRADPEIVMIGEVRDLETGDIAIKAAQTGHLVFATLHTNSAVDTIARLINMGVEPFNISSSLLMIVAQRLVRKVCSSCKIEDTDTTKENLIELGIPAEKVNDVKVYKGKGCPKCNGTGYKGRTAVYEVLGITQEIKNAINLHKPISEIKAIAYQQGMKSLRKSGIIKILKGITSVEEIFKNTALDTQEG